MAKVYAVTESCILYGDTWYNILGICSSIEIANALKNKVEEKYNLEKGIIPEDKFTEIYESLSDNDSPDYFSSKIEEIYPQYDRDDIEKAAMIYDGIRDIRVEEIEFYDNISEVKQCN